MAQIEDGDGSIMSNAELGRLVADLRWEVIDFARSRGPRPRCRCGCKAGSLATDQELDDMIQELAAGLPSRPVEENEQVECDVPDCPECYVASLPTDLDDQTLRAMADDLLRGYQKLEMAVSLPPDSNLPGLPAPSLTAPCRCSQVKLMHLPPELRSEIWALALDPAVAHIATRLMDPTVAINYSYQGGQVTRYIVGQEECHYPQFTYQPALPDFLGHNFNLLRVNRQINQEATEAFYRRNTLRFGSIGNGLSRHYHGIIAAWAFFNDRRDETLPLIRRLHIDLVPGGFYASRNLQTLSSEPDRNPTSDGLAYLDRLLDLMRTRLTNLRHLSLVFSGWVPDMRTDPWTEGRPGPPILPPASPPPMRAVTPPPGGSPAPGTPPPPPSSRHWVQRLQGVGPVARLTLQVQMTIPGATRDNLADSAQHTARAVHFLRTLRDSMLVNGAALGEAHIRVRAVSQPGSTNVLVECDDEWRQTLHVHHLPDLPGQGAS